MYANIIDNLSVPLATDLGSADTEIDIGSSAYATIRGLLTNFYEDEVDAGVFHPYSGFAPFFTLDDGSNIGTFEVAYFDDNTEIIGIIRDGDSHSFVSGTPVELRSNAGNMTALHESAVLTAISQFGYSSVISGSFSASSYTGGPCYRVYFEGSDDIECDLVDFGAPAINKMYGRLSHADYDFILEVVLLGTGSVTFVSADSTIVSPGGFTKLATQGGVVRAIWLHTSAFDPQIGRWILDSNVDLVAP